MKKALILLAEGTEETEAVTTIDLLTRAGITVVSASVSQRKKITCSRGVVIVAEQLLSEQPEADFDVIILPGGQRGAEQFRDTDEVITKLQQAHKRGCLIAAICAAPATVLVYHRLFPIARMTGYPTTKAVFKHWQDKRVVYDPESHLITSQGLGTTMDFALMIINVLIGAEKAHEIAKGLVLPAGINDYSRCDSRAQNVLKK